MKLEKIFSLLVLLSLLVFIASPATAQNLADDRVTGGNGLKGKARQIFPATSPEDGWITGPFPPNNFQYARHDGVFVPGPALETWANKVYFLGGRTSPPSESPKIWMFDPVSQTYTDTGANVVEDVSNYNGNLILDDGTGRGPAVYVIGGTDKDHGGVNIGTVQRYYPMTNQAEALPQADNFNVTVSGYRVACVGSAVVDEKIYVYGGWESSAAPYFSSETWVFDPNQPSGSRWTNLAKPLSVPRSYIMSAVQGDKIYAIGGVGFYDGSELNPVAAVEVFDTASPGVGWTMLAPLLTAGGEGRAFGFQSDTLHVNYPWDGKIYVVAANDWAAVSSEFAVYDVGANAWDDTLPELPTARADLAASYVPLCTSDPDDGLPGMWTFGGRINESCDPPLGPVEFYSLVGECLCPYPLENIDILGPVQLEAGTTGNYTATIEPVTATAPVSVDWSTGDEGPFGQFTAPTEPGWYTLAITGTNCDGSGVVTETLEIEVYVALESVTIAGPTALEVGEVGTYTATTAPDNATPPIEFAWSNGTAGAQADYSWVEPGNYTIVVTATNPGGSVVGTLPVVVTEPCIPLETAVMTGPLVLEAGEPGLYTVEWAPGDASLPVDILWSNGITGTEATYTWETPGYYHPEVAATNCGGTVTDTLLVYVSEVCIPLTGVSIEGPATLLVGETGIFSATSVPPDATEPVNFLWDNGITGPLNAYAWDVPGTYTIVITAENCGETVVTSSYQVEVVAPCVPVNGAVILGPVEVMAGELALYSVSILPEDATPPFEILWSNGITLTDSLYVWEETGLYTVTVSVDNCGPLGVSIELEVNVIPAVYPVYLPVILRPDTQ